MDGARAFGVNRVYITRELMVLNHKNKLYDFSSGFQYIQYHKISVSNNLDKLHIIFKKKRSEHDFLVA